MRRNTLTPLRPMLTISRPLAKVCNHEKMRVAPQLRYVGVEALAGKP